MYNLNPSIMSMIFNFFNLLLLFIQTDEVYVTEGSMGWTATLLVYGAYAYTLIKILAAIYLYYLVVKFLRLRINEMQKD